MSLPIGHAPHLQTCWCNLQIHAATVCKSVRLVSWFSGFDLGVSEWDGQFWHFASMKKRDSRDGCKCGCRNRGAQRIALDSIGVIPSAFPYGGRCTLLELAR